MNRRGFLTGMLALGAAPAIVRAESLMKLWVPREPTWVGIDLGIIRAGTITADKLAPVDVVVDACTYGSTHDDMLDALQYAIGALVVRDGAGNRLATLAIPPRGHVDKIRLTNVKGLVRYASSLGVEIRYFAL